MKIPFPLLLLALLTGCSNEIYVPKPTDAAGRTYENHPQHTRYQQILESYIHQSKSPGGILLVDRPGESLWIGATGSSNLKHNTLFHTQTNFRTGSVTKMFTAAVIMKLISIQTFTLENTLADLLPETIGEIPQADKINVRFLLAHLSGIIDPPNDNLGYQSALINNPTGFFELSTRELLRRYVYGKKLKSTPGTTHYYSNVNYWLLGLIAERSTNKSLQQLMVEYIFEPLGMTSSFVEARSDQNVARGYADLYNDGVLMDVTLWDRAEGDGQADGGLISTAEDLQIFLRGLFSGKIIPMNWVNEMKRMQLENCSSPECEYGLGIELYRTDSGWAYGHSGALVGIESSALYYEQSGAIVVMFKNSGNSTDKSYMNALGK